MFEIELPISILFCCYLDISLDLVNLIKSLNRDLENVSLMMLVWTFFLYWRFLKLRNFAVFIQSYVNIDFLVCFCYQKGMFLVLSMK